MSEKLILGAGMTGLSASIASGLPVYEASSEPGGICSSYYVRPGESTRLPDAPADGEAYRFEIGGGHWIFGGDPAILRFMSSLAPMKSYARKSAVDFSEQGVYVPYPIQNHLGFLPKDVAGKALAEMASAPSGRPRTMADWITQSFGQTLTDLFFAPFHELYTAGLWTRIAPQDAYKSPVSLTAVIQGAFDQAPPVGYNTTYVYPVEGLNRLSQRMAELASVRYGKTVVKIDVKRKEVLFADGSGSRYDLVASTLPLNYVLDMTGIEVEAERDPYTSVLVLNIGGTKGPRCPDEHWLYNPDAKAGFHRVGFYSNVDTSFLPASSREDHDRVSIYVERAYPGGQKPSDAEIDAYAQATVQELRDWGYIDRAEVVDPTWIDVAYTWSWPGSGWKQQALRALEEQGVYQVGRYGRWIFQGIADSIRDGFIVGASLKG